jgi:myo-inositol-1(or 4)-monophosphatase
MTPDLLPLSLSVADLCRQAGAFIREQVSSFDQSKIVTKGLHDLVSYVDKESEKMLVEGLQKLYPEAGFVTEEGTVANTDASETEYRWIIDPLDGTTNFIHGLPCFAVSVALARGNRPVLGVVYEVSRDECFRGAEGLGAFLNDKPIQVSAATSIEDTLIATGLPFYKFTHADAYLKILAEYMQHSRGIRRWGSAATDLAYVACGRFDSYFEFNINSYDVAAGILLVREAGGRVTQWLEDGDPVFNRETLATNNHVHEQMQAVLKQHWGEGFQW